MSVPGYIATRMKKPRHEKVAAWVQAIYAASGAASQDALAETLQVSRSGFAKWYYGDQRPRLPEFQKLEALASSLGVPPLAKFDSSQPRGSTGMSDPRSIDASDKNLEAFLARNADDITER